MARVQYNKTEILFSHWFGPSFVLGKVEVEKTLSKFVKGREISCNNDDKVRFGVN